jgi:hypothetical protein
MRRPRIASLWARGSVGQNAIAVAPASLWRSSDPQAAQTDLIGAAHSSQNLALWRLA